MFQKTLHFLLLILALLVLAACTAEEELPTAPTPEASASEATAAPAIAEPEANVTDSATEPLFGTPSSRSYTFSGDLEKVEPILLDLLILLNEPDRPGAREQLQLIGEEIVLPEEAGFDEDFWLEILFGLKADAPTPPQAEIQHWLKIDDLGLLAASLGLAPYAPCSENATRLDYDKVDVFTGKILVRASGKPPLQNQPLLALAAYPDVVSIQPSYRKELDLDISVPDTWAATPLGAVYTGINASSLRWWGLDGKNVIVGILDGGIDWDHEAFTLPGIPETSRLLAQWDQASNSFLNQGAFDRYLSIGVQCATGTRHATHVAGIATGDDSVARALNFSGEGVAPAASIVDVITAGGDRDILLGAAYIFMESKYRNQPAVVNISLGSHYGPHDGTGLDDIGLGRATGPGCLIVKSAGNDGNKPIHTDNDGNPIVAGGMGAIEFQVDPGTTLVDIRIWFDRASGFEVGLVPPILPGSAAVSILPVAKGKTEEVFWQVKNPLNLFESLIQAAVSNTKAHTASDSRMAQITLRAFMGELPPGIYRIDLSMPTGATGSGQYDAWIAKGKPKGNVKFVAPTYRRLISEPGNAARIITVGSFDARDYIVDGKPVCAVGQRSAFSSMGPARLNPSTGRAIPKPDISAPGCPVFAAEWSAFQNLTSNYIPLWGTSMAAPHTTGCLALGLQSNPAMTPENALALLQTLTRDVDAAFLGIPDFFWGAGKLDCGADKDKNLIPDLFQVKTIINAADGELLHTVDTAIDGAPGGVDVESFGATVTFTNPYSAAEGQWDYGLLFRHTTPDQFYSVRVESSGAWRFKIKREGVWETLQEGTLSNLRLNAGEQNAFQLIVNGKNGLFYMNGERIAELDTSALSGSGDIWVATNILNTSGINGKSTGYQDFSIWSFKTLP
ncbi:MAG: S8 family serine peptidase [Anaerolineae bacterium]|nr:S8 family serine peptidase [Anaerolineae bacterium]